MKKYAQANISRRTFLGGGALLGAGVVAAVTLPNAALAAGKKENEKTQLTTSKNEDGYRLTQHIADYYKSAAL